MTTTNFIGRTREVAQLDLAVGDGTDGLRLAKLSGPSGLGKTTLSSVIAGRAADRGFRVATVNGRAGCLSTPLAPFIEAMPEFEVLLSVLAVDSQIDIEHAGIGLVNLLAELVQDRPLLLVFDDAQALDESSIALLPYVVGVSERMNITLLFVEQTDAIDIPSSYRAFIDGLLARRVVGHLQIGPMDDESVRELVADHLDVPTDSVPGEILVRAQGNPWFAKELADAYHRGGGSDIPTNIAAAATARLHSLDEPSQDLVLAVALCTEGAHIGWLERLSESAPRAFVRQMEAINASGLVREDGDLVSIAHPLMQQALSDELSAAMRRAIHLEIAGVIAEVPMSEVVASRSQGAHLSAAGRPDEAVDHFLRAASANEVLGQLHEAYADLTRALGAEPRVDARVDLLRRCASMAMQLGMQVAVDHWAELGRLAAAMHDNELYGFALFQQYWASNDGTAAERLQRAAALGSDTFGWSARAAATIARMNADYETAVAHDEFAIEVARTRGDGLLEALALEKLASSLADQGRSSEAIARYREAIERAVSLRLHDWAAVSWGSLVETLLDDLDTPGALAEAEAVVSYVLDLGLDRMRPALLAWKANALLHAGDLDRAMEVIEEASVLDLGYRADPQYRADHFGLLVLLIHAEVASEMGRPDAIQRAQVAHSVMQPLGFASWSYEAERTLLRAHLNAASDVEVDAGVSKILDCSEPTLLADVALSLLRSGVLGGNEHRVRHARDLRDRFDGWGSNATSMQSKRELDAVLGAVDGGDLAALDEVALAWTSAGRALDAVRVTAVTGALALRRGDQAAARTYLQAAKNGLQTCGASGDADLVASLLRQTGARSRAKSRTTSVGPLTKRELEIARLVASGLKNSEVAGTLFLAEKTVAAHLSNIYGKVEVRSRVQLGQWIRENDPDFEATALASAG